MSPELEQSWTEARRQSFKEALAKAGLKAFVFDLDDTLKRTYFTEGRRIYLEALKLLSGREIEEKAFMSAWHDEFKRLRSLYGTNPRIHWQISQQMAGQYGIEWESEPLQLAFNEMWQRIYMVVPEPMPGAVETIKFLNDLDQGTYVITHAHEDWTKLKLSDWPDYFDGVYCVDIDGPKDAMAWNAGLKTFGLEPHQIVVAGDNPEADINSCRQLGVKHLFLMQETQNHHDEEIVDVNIINDLRHILSHLENSLILSSKD